MRPRGQSRCALSSRSTRATNTTVSSKSSAATAQPANQVLAVTLAQIGPAAGHAAEKIAHPLDGTHFQFRFEDIVPKPRGRLRSVCASSAGRNAQVYRPTPRVSAGSIDLPWENLLLHCSVMQCRAISKRVNRASRDQARF